MWVIDTPTGPHEIRFRKRGKREYHNLQYQVMAGEHFLGVVMEGWDGWTSIPDPRPEDQVSLETLREELTRYGRMVRGFKNRRYATAHILKYLGYWDKDQT